MALLPITIIPPSQGVQLDNQPEAIPFAAAARLDNIRVDGFFARSRPGLTPITNAASTDRVIDLFNFSLTDGTTETFLCTAGQTFRYNSSATPPAWAAITGGTWTGADDTRFWAVFAPFGATDGRIIMGNGVDIAKHYDPAGPTLANYTGSFASDYGIVGDDNRLFIAHTIETGTKAQRVTWTIVGLTNGGAADWTDPGSGALDLRHDSFPITGLFKQAGIIYVGKTRSLARLLATGLATDAYAVETLHTGGEGVFARGSIAQHGNIVAFLTHRDVVLFDGASLQGIGGPVRRELFRRLNYDRLDQITSVVDAKENRIGWGFPLDANAVPSEIWWLDLTTGRWETDTRSHTALSIFTNVDVTTIDELVGTIDAQTGTIDGLSASSQQQPQILLGTNAGETSVFEPTATSDVFRSTAGADTTVTITGMYETAAVIPIGEILTIGGRQHPITHDDHLTLDKIRVNLLDRGDTYTLKVEYSSDGGVIWVEYGTVTLTTSAPETSRRQTEVFLSKRVSMRDRTQFRISNNTADVLWGWTKLTMFLDVVGRKR